MTFLSSCVLTKVQHQPIQQQQQQQQQQQAKQQEQQQPVQQVVQQQATMDLSSLDGRSLWLDDIIVNHAQQLLRQEFPQQRGLQNTLFSQGCKFSASRTNSIQIHHIGRRNHWVTTSSNETGDVTLYDSLRHGSDLANDLKQQVACMYKTDEPQTTVSVAIVQQQKGGSDCGIFLVAFAFDLAQGREPQYVNYIQSEMRKHLKTCIQQGTLTTFPRNFPSKQVTVSENVLVLFLHFLYIVHAE